MGNIKARDIIPGWPRGRSTSNMGSGNSARDFMETGITWPRWAWEHIGDPRFSEDLEAERAEERRKAEMMEAFWGFRRISVKYGDPDVLIHGIKRHPLIIPMFNFVEKPEGNIQDHPTPTLTAGRDPEPVLCEEERRKEKD